MLKVINRPFVSVVAFLLFVTLGVVIGIAKELRLESTAAKKLEQVAARVPGTLGYQVMTVDGDVLFSRHAEASFPQASAIKIPILLEVLARREEGKLDWNKSFRIDKGVQSAGTGILSEFSDGGSTICVADLCTLMIVVSDNTATNLLIKLVGMENVSKRMASVNCANTKLRRVMMDTSASARGEENVSTPTEAARIMQLLAQGRFHSPKISDEALAYLRQPKATAIRKAIPAEIPIANKPGAIPGVATEWALVEWPERPYIIIVMGKNGQESQFQQAFTEIAERVHQTMAEQ